MTANLAHAQKVKVFDKESKAGIQDLKITQIDGQEFVRTNYDGEADISSLTTAKSFIFSHPDYFVSEYSFRKLQKREFTISLTRRPEALQEIVLSVSKEEENIKQIAEQIEIITAADVKKLAPQTSADMLAASPGVRVQKSQFGGGSPVLRGMEANRVLMVIDGVRMNNAIYRKGHLQNSITVSPLSLERTEVIFGPSSVRYGSDALGGVIHFYTQSPQPNEDPISDVSYYTRVSSANSEYTNQFTFSTSQKSWASYTSVSHSKFGSLVMGKNRVHGYEKWGLVPLYSDNSRDFYNPNAVVNPDPTVQKNTGFNQSDVLQKFIVDLNENHQAIANFQYSQSSDIPRFDKLTEYSKGKLKFAEWYYGPQIRLMGSLQLKSEFDSKWIDFSNIVLAYQHLEEERVQRKFGSLDRSYRDEYVDVFGLNADFGVGLTDKLNLQYGLELAFNGVASRAIGHVLTVDGNQVTGYSDTFDVQSRYPDGGSTYNNQAFYVDLKSELSSKTVLNAGLRYTATQLKAKWNDQTFITLPDEEIYLNNQALTANLSLAYSINNFWQLNGLVSSGFRSPNIDDVGKIREKNGFVSVPNVDLKPEYAYNAELGLARYFVNREYRIGLNTYYTLLDDYIMRAIYDISGAPVDPSNPPTIIYDGEEVITYANVNKGTAYIYGLTLDARGRFARYYSAAGSLTYTKGRSYDEGTPLSSIPPVFGNASLGFEKNRVSLGVNFDFNGAKNAEDYNLIEGIDNIEQSPIDPSSEESRLIFVGTPNWYILNANGGFAINQHVQFQVMVNNILDQHYKEFASAISAPGRNYIATMMLNF